MQVSGSLGGDAGGLVPQGGLGGGLVTAPLDQSERTTGQRGNGQLQLMARLITLTQVMACELAPQSIRVKAIASMSANPDVAATGGRRRSF